MKSSSILKTSVMIAVIAAAAVLGYTLGHRHEQTEPAKPAGTPPKQVAAAKGRYICSMHPFIVRDEPGECPVCDMQLTPMKEETGTAAPQKAAPPEEGKPKVKYWVSSMDPTYIRHAPGKDAMGMDMVPVYEKSPAPVGQIIIDPVTMQDMGIRTATVTRRDLRRTIRTVGLVTYEEPRQYSVNSKIEGWIERLYLNETGQLVERGAPLMEIYSPDLVSAQQEYLLALETNNRLAGSPFGEISAGARRLLAAARTRLKYWDISEQQIGELEASRQVRKTMTLYSPYHGIVTEKAALAGMRVAAGMELVKISDISRVWVNADIYEYELPWVKVGLPAVVELSFTPGKPLPGEITYLYPYVEGETRTVKARIELVNPGLELKPDMYANVLIESPTVAGALAVPSDAVLDSGKSQTVFVALGEGHFAPRTVKTGVSDEQGYTQVLDGVKEGELVVTSAQFMLDSESNLREAVQKMLEPKAAAPVEQKPDGKKENLEELFK